MIRALFTAPETRWDAYSRALPPAFDALGLRVDLSRDHAPGTVDYLIYAPGGPVSDFTPFLRAKAVLCLWAGVESIVTNATLTQPLTRMVDPGLTQGMVEYVVGHTLRTHLGMDRHLFGQDGVWRDYIPPLSSERPVTLLGLGALGSACAAALATLGFPVTGWSRNPKSIPGIRTLQGAPGLRQALTGAQIVITLLPLTRDTANILNADTLSLPAPGAALINPGRGSLIDDAALLAALDSGQIGQATLDVFRTEPLPADHPFWAHPQVTVTPHIAADTRPSTASLVIAENIRRGEAGEPLLNLVDRRLGY